MIISREERIEAHVKALEFSKRRCSGFLQSLDMAQLSLMASDFAEMALEFDRCSRNDIPYDKMYSFGVVASIGLISAEMLRRFNNDSLDPDH